MTAEARRLRAAPRAAPVGDRLGLGVAVALWGLLLSETLAEALPSLPVAGYLDEALLLALLGLGVATSVRRRRVPTSAVLVPLLAFAAWAAAVSVAREVPLRIALPGLLLLLKPGLIFTAFYLLPFRDGERAARGALRWFAAAALLVTGFALLIEAPLGNPLPGIDNAPRFGIPPLRSVFVHSGPASHAAFVFVTVLAADAWVRGRRGAWPLGAAATLLLALALRAKALLLLPPVLVLVAYLAIGRGRPLRLPRVATGLVFVLAMAFVTASVTGAFSQRLVNFLAPDSDAVRTVLLRGAVDLNVRTWGTGVGAGMYGSATSVDAHYSPYYHRYGVAELWGGRPENPSFVTDQWWAWYLGETGVVGTLLFLAFLALLLRRLDRIALQVREGAPAVATLAIAAIGALAYGVVSGYAAGTLTGAPQGYLIMALAGLAFASYRAALPGRTRGAGPP